MGPTHALVHVLAERLRRPASTIHPWHSLAVDLAVTPLDLVMVTLDIESAEGAVIDVERLTDLRTVGDLSTYVKHEIERSRSGRVRQNGR
jgi:acyl carrier protein